MTVLRMTFAGEVKKADHKEVGGKKLVELSICKKNRGKAGEEDHFTWLRISLWEPADFQTPKLVKGAFIAGSGDATLRGYTDKDGHEKSSLECRCGSFDVEVTGANVATESPAPRPARAAAPSVSPAATNDDEPPF